VLAKRIPEPACVRRRIQAIVRETPARERRRVAMHDADSRPRHLRHEVHRQRGHGGAARGVAARRLAQPQQDLVRAAHLGVAHVHRIGAAASCLHGVMRELGLHVAAQRAMPGDALLDAHEVRIVHVEPVMVAVEDEHRRDPLARGHRLDRLDRLHVAVEPAHHVEHFGAQVGRAIEDARRIAVRQRAGAAGPLLGLIARNATRREAHASAPPQLEPCPAVQP
jgi:hypothetical protein